MGNPLADPQSVLASCRRATNMGARFAVILPVGPAKEEIVRARDLLDSLQRFEAGNYTLVLVDDHAGGRDLGREVVGGADLRWVVTTNPRRGRGDGWSSGAAAGTLAALRVAAQLPEHEFVVKLDTDSLVIDTFSERVANSFRRQPELGIMGAYQFSPASDRDRSSAPALEKLLRQWAVWR